MLFIFVVYQRQNYPRYIKFNKSETTRLKFDLDATAFPKITSTKQFTGKQGD